MARIRWASSLTGAKAQFIADTMKESLFNYAFDSNKTPSLNLHFFCNDFIATANLVEKGVMKDGNMVPLIEEFEHIINSSRWLPTGINRSLFLFKNKQGFYKDICQEKNHESAVKASNYKENANYVRRLLTSERPYTELVISRIHEILLTSTFSFEEKQELYFCIREFLTEVINLGMSKAHLYNQVQEKLFSQLKIEDDVKYIIKFLKGLCPKKREYVVVFGITEDSYSEMNDIIQGFRLAEPHESTKLGHKYVAETKIESSDPVSALIEAKRSLSVIFSIYNSCIHNANIALQDKGFVKDSEEGKYHFINDKTNLLCRNKNKAKQGRVNFLKIAVQKGLNRSLISAFELHNYALKTDEPQAQLLNLWTIIELLIETKQDQMNRVNFIANVLVSILNCVYFERLISTLLSQITLTKNVKNIIQSEQRGKNNLEKLALILRSNQLLQEQIISALSDYPLEAYKIELFSYVLSSNENMKEYLERHSNRLRWQIMRIYRNRCMIVHDGTHFYYLDNIVENLHYYVDELFDFIFRRIDIGISNVKAIVAYARVIDANKQQLLSVKGKTLSDDEYLSIIFEN